MLMMYPLPLVKESLFCSTYRPTDVICLLMYCSSVIYQNHWIIHIFNGPLVLMEITWTSTRIWSWISNYNDVNGVMVNTHNVLSSMVWLNAIEIRSFGSNYIPQWLIHVLISTDLSHKSHNAPVPYPTLHYFVTEICKRVHISVTKRCIVGYFLVHCGICEMGLVNNIS